MHSFCLIFYLWPGTIIWIHFKFIIFSLHPALFPKNIKTDCDQKHTDILFQVTARNFFVNLLITARRTECKEEQSDTTTQSDGLDKVPLLQILALTKICDNTEREKSPSSKTYHTWKKWLSSSFNIYQIFIQFLQPSSNIFLNLSKL